MKDGTIIPTPDHSPLAWISNYFQVDSSLSHGGGSEIVNGGGSEIVNGGGSEIVNGGGSEIVNGASIATI